MAGHARHRLFARFVLLTLLLAAFSGCATRGPNSAFVPSPTDPELEGVQESLDRLLRSPELQLGAVRDYYIGPGDVLAFSMVGRPDIFGRRGETEDALRIRVTHNPAITLPFVGAVQVHGKTAAELTADLKAAYAVFINDPEPIVTIEEFHYNGFTVLGSVRTPGRYPLLFGDTLLDSLFRAGGFTFGRDTGGPPPARYLKVYRDKVSQKERSDLPLEQLLERLREEQRIAPREEIVIPIEDFINKGQLAYNIPLMPNDIVYIPAAGTVSVQGAVRNPGVVFLGPSLRNLSHVITEKGGMKYGAASRVEVVRSESGDEPISYFFSARRVLQRKDPDFILQDGDQVFVYRHGFRSFIESVGNIFRGTISAGASATYNPL